MTLKRTLILTVGGSALKGFLLAGERTVCDHSDERESPGVITNTVRDLVCKVTEQADEHQNEGRVHYRVIVHCPDEQAGSSCASK